VVALGQVGDPVCHEEPGFARQLPVRADHLGPMLWFFKCFSRKIWSFFSQISLKKYYHNMYVNMCDM
jgi:hypothetical protein